MIGETYRILLLARELARRDEHDANDGILAFFLLDRILDGFDVERYSIAVYR